MKTQEGYISAEVVFGLDSQLFLNASDVAREEEGADKNHYRQEVDLLEIRPQGLYPLEVVTTFAESLSGTDLYRIKGVLRDEKSDYILNCAFGKSTTTRLTTSDEESRIVFMGENLTGHRGQIATFLKVSQKDIIFTPREHKL